ncbi:TonB-dependent receptor domain-containing protein [Sphingomonas cavernae]|uniref:TonB-dependent receptor n=1 Tax=Sphingomonas cavernae TaxID=2320861 RepID=A0A418WQ36_9SPHN|nr:TonB-dependent receptor [Sphingomonas cavernae]RJF93354.1 TonB-dependent receptor [Sphingomonas cavernae]
MNKRLLRLRAGAAHLAIGLAVVSFPAHAQDVAAQNEPEAIVVTGSRIAQPEIDSVSPIQVVGQEAIENSGVTNIQELLLENPVFGTPALSRTNSAFLTSGTGAATVDLRDLGSDRTLVLIDGRRVVAGLPGSSTVDLNVIPTQFVERVDILTGGASSLYGSDAVAGVVNFIYKKNFEGLIAEGQYGITERGDDAQYRGSVTFGGNFADDRGNIMVHMGYTKQEGLLSRQRANTFYDDADKWAYFTGDPADFGTSVTPYFSSFAPQGSFLAGGRTFTFDANNALKEGFSTNGPNGDGVGADGFNRQYYRTIAVPVERYLFAARGNYQVTDAINFFAEGTYANTSSSRQIEPSAIGSDDIFKSSGGLVPIETRVNGAIMLNPYVPAAIAAAATDEDGDGLRDISFSKRLSDLGPRDGSTSRDYYRFVAGLEGDVFDKFHWDVSYVYGRTSETQQSNGQPNILNFANALSAVQDLGDVNNNGLTTDVICASAEARAQGCVPINIFGFNSISPEAAKYIAAEQSYSTRITQQVVSANLSGTLFDLPAGGLGVAIGAEYRKESSRENWDALTNAGLNAGNALPDTRGSFDVKEIYGEINVPILADTPFFHDLSLRAAGRISDYSTVGTVYTYNVGAEWSPIRDIKFRGGYARSVRAPNVGELFTGASQTFPSGLVDPCAGIGLTGGGAIGDNCRAAAGVLANIQQNGVFTVNQADRQGISGYDSGNPNLKEEKSDSYTVGVAINPRSINALRNLTLTVDYYNISIKDAIVAPPRQFILDQCYGQGEQSFCDLVDRRPSQTAINSSGSLEYVDAPLFNGGKLKVEGLDVAVAYNTALSAFGADGRLSGRIAYTRVFDGYVVSVPGADKDPFAGEVGNSKDRFTANLGYGVDDFSINFTGTYIGKAYEDDQLLAAYDLDPHAIKIGSEFYLDTQARFKPTEKVEIYFGVDNLLDNKAPRLLSGTSFNTTGTDTAADVYDVFGRRLYTGVQFKF